MREDNDCFADNEFQGEFYVDETNRMREGSDADNSSGENSDEEDDDVDSNNPEKRFDSKQESSDSEEEKKESLPDLGRESESKNESKV